MEKWEQIKNHPAYAVSNLGRVYSEKRQKTLKPRLTKEGYYIVDLPLENPEGKVKYKSCYVHHLVGKTFVENDSPEIKTSLIFKDGDKTNLLSTNLEWVTKAESRAYAHTLVESLKTIKDSLDSHDMEFTIGGVAPAKLRGKNLWYNYEGKFYRIRDTKTTLGFFVKKEDKWEFVGISRLILTKYKGPQPTPKHKVGYRDWDRYNLSPLNLLWETTSEKIKRLDSFNPIQKLEKIKRAANIQQTKVRISDGNMANMSKLRSYGRSLRKLSILYKIAPSTVSRYLKQWEQEKKNRVKPS